MDTSEGRTTLRRTTVLLIPILVLIASLIVASGVVRSARMTADVANARLLLAAADMAYETPEDPRPLTDFLTAMPSPLVVGSLHRFAILATDGGFAVYALEDESSGYRYDPSLATFSTRPTPLAGAGTPVGS